MFASFEWDPDKDAENQRKHGVSFAEAQAVFLDSARVIARDLEHSRTEPRFYCFGRVADGVLTVRFTIAEMSFASSVPDTGAEARDTMKHTRKYTNEPLGRVEMVEDFLPPPDQLRAHGGVCEGLTAPSVPIVHPTRPLGDHRA